MKENNTNINQVNKLNLPTTWTKSKIMSLFLVALLKANETKAGDGFKNCLNYYRDTVSYDLLLNYPFANNSDINTGKVIEVCCDTSHNCSSSPEFFSCSKSNPNNGEFFCSRIAQNIFCYSGGPTNSCGGIVGNGLITSHATTGSNCANYNLDSVASYVSNNSGINYNVKDFAWYICPDNSPCGGMDSCSWDDGGWTCYRTHCQLQWPAPFPVPGGSQSPISSTPTVALPTNSPTPQPEGGSGLSDSDKIALGTGLGLGIPTLTLTAIATWYAVDKDKRQKIIKKFKSWINRNHQEMEKEVELEETTKEIQEENSIQAQIEVLSKQ